MLKALRSAFCVAVVLLGTAAGVAAADSSSPDSFDPDGIDQTTDTTDGNWRLHVILEHVSITSVPNMAATAFTREAYVSATATVWVEPLKPDVPTPPDDGSAITGRAISLWLQEGCQATINGATLGANNTSSAGLTGSTPSVSESPNPTYQQVLTPGTVVGKNLQNKAWPAKDSNDPLTPPWVKPGWKDDKLTVSVSNWDMKVDSCGGPVSFRFIGEATMSTQRYNFNVDAFSAIVQV